MTLSKGLQTCTNISIQLISNGAYTRIRSITIYTGSFHWTIMGVVTAFIIIWFGKDQKIMHITHLFDKWKRRVGYGLEKQQLRINFEELTYVKYSNILQLSAQWPGLWMAARLEVTLFWYRPQYFCCVNEVLLMQIRCIYMTNAERPRCHSKARSPSTQL